MKLLKNILGFFLLPYFIFILSSSQVRADFCGDSLREFYQDIDVVVNKSTLSFEDLRNFSLSYDILIAKIGKNACAQKLIEETMPIRQSMKERRIETIRGHLKRGIKTESGEDLSAEFDYLTGNLTKYNYEFALALGPDVKRVTKKIAPPKNEKCTDVIHQNEALNLTNVRNQDSVGWCYAFAAADLLSYQLKKKISAVSLYDSGQDIEKDIKSRDSENGGDIRQSIVNYIKKNNGLCLEEDLPSNDFKFCTDMQYGHFLNNFLKVIKEKRLDDELASNQCLGQNLKAAFPGLNFAQLKNYADQNGTKRIIEYLYDLQCKKMSFQNIKMNPASLTTPTHEQAALLKKLDEQISNGQVVAIGYKYHTLTGSNAEGDHASVVVGRRSNPETGACQYLVRNTWGKNCDQRESADLTCHKNCTEKGCRFSGHFWVTDERLKESLLGVTYLR